MYCVYWIKLSNHTDPTVQGYVGITSNLKERIRAHKKNKRKTHFFYAKTKYGWDNLIVEILQDNLSKQEALSIESSLRPSQNIGWNSQRGGELGVESSWYSIEENRQKHKKATSEATKKAIAEKDSKEARAQRMRECWSRSWATRVAAVTGENNPRALLTEEQVREIKSLLPEHSTRELATKFNVRLNVIQQIKSGKNWKHV